MELWQLNSLLIYFYDLYSRYSQQTNLTWGGVKIRSVCTAGGANRTWRNLLFLHTEHQCRWPRSSGGRVKIWIQIRSEHLRKQSVLQKRVGDTKYCTALSYFWAEPKVEDYFNCFCDKWWTVRLRCWDPEITEIQITATLADLGDVECLSRELAMTHVCSRAPTPRPEAESLSATPALFKIYHNICTCGLQ